MADAGVGPLPRPRRVRLHPEVEAAMGKRPLVLAVSGGGDSVALLHLVARLVGRGKLAGPVLAAHLNHQQRQPFADNAEALVRRHCGELGIGLHCVRFDRIVEDIQPPTGSSGEAWLAEHRHRHLADVAREFSRDALILTGHQADDHAESLLLGLMRGNDWAGLTFPVFQCWYGMPVAAPLALSRRTDLRQWLAGRGLDWLDDPMNSEPHSMRSVIRGLLDRLQCETARDWVLPLTRSAESLRLAGDCLQGQCERVLEECLDDGERLSIRVWRRQHGALRPGILRSYGSRTHCALSGRQVHQLAHWMETCPLREGRLVLGSDQNMVAVVHSGMLLLTRVPGSDAPPPAP